MAVPTSDAHDEPESAGDPVLDEYQHAVLYEGRYQTIELYGLGLTSITGVVIGDSVFCHTFHADESGNRLVIDVPELRLARPDGGHLPVTLYHGELPLEPAYVRYELSVPELSLPDSATPQPYLVETTPRWLEESGGSLQVSGNHLEDVSEAWLTLAPDTDWSQVHPGHHNFTASTTVKDLHERGFTVVVDDFVLQGLAGAKVSLWVKTAGSDQPITTPVSIPVVAVGAQPPVSGAW